MMLQPRVIDISHHNTVDDLAATANAGIWGIIHKASEGAKYRDPDYAKRRELASQHGLLWAAYHFNNGADVPTQVQNFLEAAQPDNTTMLVLDYEDNPKSNMSPQQMVQFLRLIEKRTGRKATIYSGNRMKETIVRLSQDDRAYVCSHPLWLCQYGPQPKLPAGFTRSFLWQFTDGRFGPQPHGIAGIGGDVDLNAFNGTRADLEAIWIGPEDAVVTSDRSSHSAQIDEDVPTPAPSRSDDTIGDIPPFLVPVATGGLNVQPPSARYDIGVEVVQRELDALGYHEVGDIDGLWGGKTAAAIKAFFTDRGIEDKAEIGPTLNNAIARAKLDRNRDGSAWSRPISTARANAKPEDIAPKVEAVRVSLWQRFGAKIAAVVSALGITGSTLSSAFSNVQSALQPVHDAFAKIPPEVWFLICGAVAGLVWYGSTRAAQATTKDYNTGRLS